MAPPSRERWLLDCLAAAAGGAIDDRAGMDLDAAFTHLARTEEAPPDAPADAHGRYPADASSIAAGAAPLDELVLELRARNGIEPPPYPGGARFAVALTHDIDTPWRWTRAGLRGAAARGRAALVGRQPRVAAREAAGLALAPLHRVRGTDPNWSHATFGAMEHARGFRSTSFVIAAHHDPHDGAAPDAYAARRLRLVRELLAQGDEVGLHASYTAGDDPDRLRSELEALRAVAGAPVSGARFHYLRMRWHEAIEALDALGLDYDTTLGWTSRPGPRAGLSFPFKPWSLTRASPLRIVEIPLLLMDATLAEERYLGLSPAGAEAHVERVLDELARVGGAGAILWHNDRFDRVYGRGWGRLYERLLDGIAARGGIGMAAADLAAHWRTRCGS